MTKGAIANVGSHRRRNLRSFELLLNVAVSDPGTDVPGSETAIPLFDMGEFSPR